MPTDQPDEMYVGNSKDLKDLASINSDATLGNNTRTWFVPTSDPEWQGDLFNIEQLGAGFGRASLNQSYQDTFDGSAGGKTGDTAATKIQADLLAARERAFRLRHASSIRCAIHAAARKKGHSDDEAGIFARIDTFIQDMMASARDGDKL